MFVAVVAFGTAVTTTFFVAITAEVTDDVAVVVAAVHFMNPCNVAPALYDG